MPGTSRRFPAADEYNSAVQQPQSVFQDPDLRQGQVQYLPPRFLYPWGRAGRFAVVYRIEIPTNPPRAWAVRCFLQHYADYMERYNKIHLHLAQKRLRYFVDFEYQEKGIKVGTEWYPIVKMEWVEGTPLIEFIKKNLNYPNQLKNLAQQWVTMLEDLRIARIAHGDLQHGNILISNTTGELKLVDYDGMWVPALSGMGSHEIGHANYQHPNRSEKDFGDYLDNFSGWLIYTALLALANEPGLWKKFGGDEHLLFQKNDLYNPNASQLFRHLRSHSDPEVQAAAEQLYKFLQTPFDKVPPLQVPLLSPTARFALAIVEAWKDPQKRHWAEQQLAKLNVIQITEFLELFEYSDPSISSADVKLLFTVLVQKNPNPTIEALVKGLEHKKLIIRKESANIIRHTKVNHVKVRSALWRRLEIPDEDFDVQREVLNALQHIEGDHAIVKALRHPQSHVRIRTAKIIREKKQKISQEVLEALYECLGDISLDVWQAAVEALKATEGEAAIIKAFAHASTNVKIGAIRACREFKPVSRDVQEALIQLLGADEYEVWQTTAEFLLETLHVRDFLDILSRHPEPKVRIGVIAIFSWKGIKGDSVIQALIKCLGDVEVVREEAAKTLNSFNKNEAFYKALENPDPSIRAGAAWALGRLHIATLETRKALQKRLGDDEETVRRAAAQALYELEGVNALTEVLLHQNVKIRIGATQALGWLHINEPFVIEALKERLGDTDDLVRQTAAEVLRDFGHVSAIIDALDHPQHEVRAGAAKALCHLHVVSYPAVEALRKRLSDPHDTVWKAVAETLRRIGRINIIEEALNDASPSMRGAAARVLRYLGIKTPQVLNALKNRLGDDEEIVQREAAEALSALGYDKLIIEALSSPEVRIRLGAIRAVEWLNLRNQSAIEVLKERLGDDESSIYESAAEVLIKLRGVGILSNSLSHPNPRVRARAAMLLQKLQITTPEARKALQKCLGDDVEAVRQAAAEALYELWGIEPLVEILKHPQSPKLRSGAAQALQWLRVNDRAAIDALKEALGDSHPQVHSQVTQSLFLLAGLEAFIEALGHPASSVRAGAAQALGQLKVADPAVITALQERLADSSRGIRQAATKALLAIGDLSLIIATLSHPNPSVRIGAAAALKQLKISDASVVKALQQHLSDPVLSVRREVADALFAIGGEAAFIDAFSHPIAEVRLNAILELERFAISPVALSELLKCLADEDDRIRQIVARTLWKFGGIDIFLNALNHFDQKIRVNTIKFIQSLATVTPPVIAVLTECLADSNATVRQEAMKAIQTLGGTDAFIEALQHPRRKIRIAAARALGRLCLPDPKVSLALRQSLSIHDLALSLAAAKALLAVSFRQFCSRKSQPHSRRRRGVRSGQQNGKTRRLAVGLVVVIGLGLLAVLAVHLIRAGDAPFTSLASNSSPEEVIKQLEHPEPSVREKAIRKLQQEKSAQVIPLLQQRLADSVTSVRQAAIQALLEVGGMDALLAALSHPSPAVRENATESLMEARHLLPDTSSTRVINSLQHRLADSVTTVRQAAFRTLLEIGGVDALLRAFSHPSAAVRTGAIQALREGRHIVPTSSVTAPLQERLADSIISVRQVALRTLLEIGGIDALFHALSHPSAAVRAQAARALGEIPEDHWQIIPKLQDRLSDPSPAVRQATKEALRKRLQRSHRRM